MADHHVSRVLFATSFRNFWEVVEVIDRNRVDAILKAFVGQHVRQEFRTKFMRTFHSRPRLGVRFYVKPKLADRKDELRRILGITAPRMTAEVFWDFSEDPLAFRLEGPPQSASNLFIDDGDALALVTWTGGSGYLLLDRDDRLWAFPPVGRKQ